MKRLRVAVGLLVALACVPALAQTGMVTVSGSNLVDSTGAAITNATISFAPVNSLGQPVSYRIDGKGQAIDRAVTAQVTNGAFTLSLADTSLTSPVNVCYQATVTDNTSGDSLLGSGYSCVQPAYSNSWCSAGVCNFDNYTPVGVAGSLVTAPSLAMGTVTTLAPGSQATASFSGSNPSYTLNLGLPAGASPSVAIGTVTALSPGAQPTASITGTNPFYLNLGIPGSGTATAGGASGQVQVNNGGLLGGASPEQVAGALQDANGNVWLSNTAPAAGFPLPSGASDMFIAGPGAGAQMGNYSPVTTTGTATSGSTSLSVASATGIAQYNNVAGTGIAAGTTVASISGTTVTLSLPTTGAVSGNVTFTPGNFSGAVAVGFDALHSATNQTGTVALGIASLYSCIGNGWGGEDGNNVAVGPFTLYNYDCNDGTNGENVAIANKALEGLVQGAEQVGIGSHTGVASIIATTPNTMLGAEILNGSSMTGATVNLSQSTLAGFGVMSPRNGCTSCTGPYTATADSIYGYGSGYYAFNASNVSIFGANIGSANVGPWSSSNDLFGGQYLAGKAANVAYSILLGGNDANSNTTGNAVQTANGLTIVGYGANGRAIPASYSSIFGYDGAWNATTEIDSFGQRACASVTSGVDNTCIGYAEGALWTGDHGTFVGGGGYEGGQGAGSYDFAFGAGAQVGAGVNYAGQLGDGINTTSDTLQFRSWNFLTDTGDGSFHNLNFSGVLVGPDVQSTAPSCTGSAPYLEYNGTCGAGGGTGSLPTATLYGQTPVSTGAGGTYAAASQGISVRAVSSSTDTIACTTTSSAGDRGGVIDYNSSSAIAVTVPDPSTSGCGSGMAWGAYNQGAGTVTFTRGTSATFTVLNGASTVTTGATSFSLATGQYATVKTDGTDWIVWVSPSGGGASSATETFVQDAAGFQGNNGINPTAANAVDILGSIATSGGAFNSLLFYVTTADTTAGDLYSVALLGPNCVAGAACPVALATPATAFATTGAKSVALSGAPVTLAPGQYWVAFTGNATTGAIAAAAGSYPAMVLPFSSGAAATASSGGAFPSSVTLASSGAAQSNSVAWVGVSK